MKEKILAKNKEHLRVLINEQISLHGYNCDLNFINTSILTDMSDLFYASKFNGDISEWDTHNVEDMSFMFSNSKFNGDISNYDTSKVLDMNSMFSKAIFNGDISKWNTENVTDMDYMFSEALFNHDISNWNVEKVQSMIMMFFKAQFNLDLNNWKPYSLHQSKKIVYDIEAPYWANKDNNNLICEAINSYVEKKNLKIKLENKLISNHNLIRRNKI